MKKKASDQEHKQHSFDCFCKRVLKNEAINIQKQNTRLSERFISFSELSEEEWNQLHTLDEYPSDYYHFKVLEYDIAIKNELLGEVLLNLSVKKRDILLLSYFLDFSDREIAEALNLMQNTVQYQRTSTLKKLQQRMEEQHNEK